MLLQYMCLDHTYTAVLVIQAVIRRPEARYTVPPCWPMVGRRVVPHAAGLG
jgi:hypothetical protein